MNRKRNYHSANLEKYILCLDSSNFKMIPWVFCVFAENSANHKVKAAQALNDVLNNLSFKDICNIDMQMRQTTSMEWSINWRTLNIDNFITPKMTREQKRAVIIFSSFNPNGYIRQKAVELLSLYELTLPYIILRQNDWVEQVRQSANNSFLKMFDSAGVNEILISLPFFEKLRRSKCDQYSVVYEHFYQKMCKNENKHILEMSLISKEAMTKKFCYSILFKQVEENFNILKNQIYKEKDPFFRRQIFQSLVTTNIDITDISDKLLTDKNPANKILALQYLYKNDKDTAILNAKSMLLNKNSSVRAYARNILHETNTDFNFYNFFIENLDKNPTCAILGLGDVGSADDCIIIEKYLYSSKVTEIRASMISLMRLNANKYGEIILEMLLSEHDGIVKTAKILIEKYAVFNFERIFEIYQTTSYENTKIQCASLLLKAAKWQRLIYILSFLSSDYESIQDLSQRELSIWLATYNRSYSTFTEIQRVKIIELMHTQKEKIDKNVLSQLMFIVF